MGIRDISTFAASRKPPAHELKKLSLRKLVQQNSLNLNELYASNILWAVEHAMFKAITQRGPFPSFNSGIAQATPRRRKENVSMTKTLDLITEIIRNPKHPFRKADDRPVKAQKHRYERRKIKEIIRLGDWGAEGTT